MSRALRLRGTVAALALLVAANASAQGAPEHQLSVYFHSTAQAYLSPKRTLAGVGGVDLLLVARQRSVAAGVGIEAATALRDPDRWSAALVGGVGQRLDPGGGQGR